MRSKLLLHILYAFQQGTKKIMRHLTRFVAIVVVGLLLPIGPIGANSALAQNIERQILSQFEETISNSILAKDWQPWDQSPPPDQQKTQTESSSQQKTQTESSSSLIIEDNPKANILNPDLFYAIQLHNKACDWYDEKKGNKEEAIRNARKAADTFKKWGDMINAQKAEKLIKLINRLPG